MNERERDSNPHLHQYVMCSLQKLLLRLIVLRRAVWQAGSVTQLRQDNNGNNKIMVDSVLEREALCEVFDISHSPSQPLS